MKTLSLAVIILAVSAVVSCKKEKTPAPAPQSPAPLVNKCTAQVDEVTRKQTVYLLGVLKISGVIIYTL